MDSWYVLHVKTGNEIDTLESVKRGMPDAKALVPQRILKERKNGKVKTVTRTLFPGYVFIKTMMDVSIYYQLNSIPTVIKILGNEQGPLPVPQDEMKVVLRLSGDGDPLGISALYYEGSSIKVNSGPLVGYEGKIVKIEPRRFRAKVNMSLFGEPRIVELGIEVIEKI